MGLLRRFVLAIIALTPWLAAAQDYHVKFSYESKKLSDGKYELIFKADIAPGYHLYSQIPTPDGPLPTEFVFDKNAGYKLEGKTKEPAPHVVREPMFADSLVRSFEKSAVFRQVVKLLTNRPVKITGTIAGMACNDSQCEQFNPPFDFTFTIHDPELKVSEAGNESDQSTFGIRTSSNVCVCDTNAIVQAFKEQQRPTATESVVPVITKPAPVEHRTYWALFIAGFIGGLFALLTPCVFPMIPMTVSFFTKQSKNRAAGIRNALLYSISIVAIYVILGLGITVIFGADALNNLATNAWFNIAFFLLLVIFAVSFLGAFEITLPSAFVNRMDAKSDRGGYIGIFFMAFTLGLVSFSCTGPIIGTLLVQAASAQALAGPFFGMFGFSLALALPFGLFAAFPGWLNSLPKSGGWLNSVKVVLGMLELALAMKFLSNADLVYDAMIITREVFIITWIVIFGLMGIYLMGWFRLPHDSHHEKISVGRLMMAIVVFSFTFYLIPGLWGAPLKLISGFPPPLDYTESKEFFGLEGTQSSASEHSSLPAGMHSGPHGIPAFDDYYKALEYSKKVNKPIMLDFTGKACINCRKMEEQVWSDPRVKKKLSEEFLLVSLYVDKKNELPAELQKEVNWHGKNRVLRTVGDRWSYLENVSYHHGSQPQYYIIDSDERHYGDSTSYDPDIEKYIRWLDSGLALYKKKTSQP